MIPYERKYKSARDGYTPKAMTVVASNDPISGPNQGSAMERRRVTVYFNHAVDERNVKQLIEFRETGELYGELVPHISAFMRHRFLEIL